MRFTLPDGQEINLKPLSDKEYDQIGDITVCPTCGGKEEYLVPGVKEFKHRTYKYQGEEQECICESQIALFTRYRLAQIGDQYMRLDWQDFHGTEDADKWVREYIENWRGFFAHGFGLTFSSKDLGVGKTWAATHIGKELIKRNQKVYFQDFVQMVDTFCSDPDQKRTLEVQMKEVPLLIVDDVLPGISERQRDLYAMKFEVVIRHRTNFSLPTIFTTNMTKDQFEQEFGRLYSLTQARQQWIKMSGADHRKRSETASEIAAMIINGEIAPIT